MKIIDSSSLIYCYDNGVKLNGDYYVVGDLDEEFELVELIHNEKRTNVLQASSLSHYSEAYYLAQYSVMLNKHAGHSFTSMRGFGDIAILALVQSSIDNFGRPNQTSLDLFNDTKDGITVITNDVGLTKRLRADFDESITILSNEDL
jgi:hypothetical protein